MTEEEQQQLSSWENPKITSLNYQKRAIDEKDLSITLPDSLDEQPEQSAMTDAISVSILSVLPSFFLVNALVDSIDPALPYESWQRAGIFLFAGIVSVWLLQLWYNSTASRND